MMSRRLHILALCLLFLTLLAGRGTAAPAQQSVNLKTIFTQWGFTRLPPVSPEIVRWQKQNILVELEANKSHIGVNGVRVYLGTPVKQIGDAHFLASDDFQYTLYPIIAPRHTRESPARRVRHVLLDPGHGGTDVGRQNKTGLTEKMAALDVARRVKFLLERQNIRVTLTRSTDINVSLDDRAAMSKKVGADIFVSIHFNAADNAPAAIGIETYSLTPRGQYSTNDTRRAVRPVDLYAKSAGHNYGNWNTLLAYNIHLDLLGKLGAQDRGLRRARFLVLRETACPAVLVECGFLSNATESAQINQGVYREKIAQGIVNGILRYRKTVDAIAPREPLAR